MNILITGGCGFIGTNLIKRISQSNYYIKTFDNLSVGINGIMSPSYTNLILGDIRDEKLINEATKDVDIVVHLAAHTSVVDSIREPQIDCEINVLGTLNLLRACVKNCVKKFIFASSNAAVGSQEPPVNERKLPLPLSPYGASKLACEGYCSAFYRAYGIETVILRFSNVYGPYSAHKSSVIPRFIKASLNGRLLTVYGDGTQTRDFVYVDDICSTIMLCIEKENIGGETFQVGTGIEVPIIELAQKIKAISGENLNINFKPARRGEIFRNFSEINRAKNILAYQPSFILDRGLALTYQWFNSLDRKILLEFKETGDE